MASLGRLFMFATILQPSGATELPAGPSLFKVRQNWSQWPDGLNRKVHSLVSGSGGPVTIVLHGKGGQGLLTRDSYIGHELTRSNEGNNVMLFPDGYESSWNIWNDPSKADDVEFIERIVDHISNYSNVNISAGVTLAGYSHGCALIYNTFIASDRWEIQRAICGVTALSTEQYRNGVFYKRPTPESNYTSASFPPTNRTLWVVQGVLDDIVPWDGGLSKVIGLTYHSAKDSIQAWASYFGSATSPADISHGYGKEHVYLDGRVKLYEFSQSGHDLEVTGEAEWTAIRKELMDSATTGLMKVVPSNTPAIAMSHAAMRAAWGQTAVFMTMAVTLGLISK